MVFSRALFEPGGSTRDALRSDSGRLIGAAGQRKDKRRIRVEVEAIKQGARARIR
jgi:hypothetical protein